MVALAVAAAFIVAWIAGHLMVRIGQRLDLVDRPDDPTLKVHRRPAVPLGGIAVLTGLVVGSSAGGFFDGAMLAVAALMVLLGLIDDRMNLPPWFRLAAEIAIAALAVGIRSTPLRIDVPLEALVGISLIVVTINAVNLFDGLDALAGSASVVAFVGLAGLATLRGLDASTLLVIAGAVAGFLVLNRPPARLFLGDNGSYLIGFLLAVMILRVSPSGIDVSLAIAGLVLGVFVLDLSVTVLRRRRAGTSLFVGDRSHLYDRLHARGWSVASIAVVAAGLEVVFVGASLIIEQWWASPWAVVLTGAVCLVAVAALARLDRTDLPGVVA